MKYNSYSSTHARYKHLETLSRVFVFEGTKHVFIRHDRHGVSMYVQEITNINNVGSGKSEIITRSIWF